MKASTDIASKSVRERLAAARRRDTPPDVLLALARDPDWTVCEAVSANLSAPPLALDVLGSHSKRLVRQQVSANPRADPGTLHSMRNSRDWEVLAGIAMNPRAWVETLDSLGLGDDRLGLRADARSTGLTEDMMWSVCRCADPVAKWHAARNPKTPPWMLAGMSATANECVLREIALNPNTPQQTLHVLSSHGSAIVRRAVVMNPNTPRQALFYRFGDADIEARTYAVVNAGAILYDYIPLREKECVTALVKVAADSASPDVLGQLANLGDAGVQLQVAGNKNASYKTLRSLMASADDEIRRAAASNLCLRSRGPNDAAATWL